MTESDRSVRCTCYVRGAHGEKPRKRIMPAKKSVMGHFLPAVETDDPRCPVHGIAGRKIMRRVADVVIRPVPGQFETVFLKRTVDGPFLPRVGELVLIGGGGWSEEVRAVWHEPGKRTVVEIGKSTGVDDGQGEGLVDVAREGGWS